MIIDTDILFTQIGSKLIATDKQLVSMSERHPEYNEIISKQRYFRDLKTSLLNLETFACIEENKNK